MVPILKDTKDPHYRYKMPKLTAKVEGSGNGIRTVITNMSAIARALDRPPTYPTKYFGCELGAQVTMSSEFVVNGSHDPDKLMNLLYGFIRKFVLCTKCTNPETTLTITNQTIRQKCIACGHEAVIPKTIHKLTTFIINHPPDGSNPAVNGSVKSSSSKSESKSKSKSGKKSGKADAKNGSDKNGGGSPNNGDSGDNDKNDDFDDFDEEEFTADAYTERLRELRGEVTNTGMYLNDTKESANMFYKLVKEKKETGVLGDQLVHKELVREAERLDIKDKSTLVLSELLFTENIVEEIKLYRMLFLRFCAENKKAQKYLLGGFEKLVGDVYKDKLFGSALKILKQFYDEDIIEEEVIIEWAAKQSKKYVSKEMSKKIHEKVEPFVKWLKEAEVEDEEDEEDASGDEKPNKSKTNGNSNGQATAGGGGGGKNGKEETNGNGGGGNQRKSSLEDDENDDDLFEFSHKVSGIRIEEVKAVQTPKAVNADLTSNGQADAADDIDIDQI